MNTFSLELDCGAKHSPQRAAQLIADGLQCFQSILHTAVALLLA